MNEDACGVIRAVAADRTDGLETGGALFGFDPGRGQVLTVTDAIGPGPGATHAPRRFERDLDYTHQQALDIYERTGAEWVGEWHTHPDGGVMPSGLDMATYLQHLDDPALAFDRFAAVIVVPRGPLLRAVAWEITAERAVGRRLRL